MQLPKVRDMNTKRKVSVAFNDASTALQATARKRRRAAFKYWKTGKTFREVGEEFGVSRQRASAMVRQAESEIIF